MFTSSTVSIFLFAVALSRGQMDEDPECRPPHPHGSEGECCTVPELFSDGTAMNDLMRKCHDEAGLKRPSRPHGGGPPSAEEMAAHMSAHECADECILKNQGLLTSDGELDKDAITALVNKMYTGDWAKLASESVANCLASAKAGVGASATCKSGSNQLIRCYTRALFLNCPATSWTESTECAAAKARITKCPNAKVPMGRPKH